MFEEIGCLFFLCTHQGEISILTRWREQMAATCTIEKKDHECKADPVTGEWKCLPKDGSTCYEEWDCDDEGNPNYYMACSSKKSYPACK